MTKLYLTWVAAGVVGALLLGTAPAGALTTGCLTGNAPEVAGDAAAVRATRAAIDAFCPCSAFDGLPGRNRSAYSSCAGKVVAAMVDGGHLRRQCRSTVRRMSSISTCGFPANRDAVICVREMLSSGAVSCAVRAPSSRCASVPGRYVASACQTATHCIDAADTNGDLLIAAGDSGSCAGATQPTPTPRPTATPRPTTTPSSSSPDPFPTGSGGERLAQLVNEYRVSKGKAPLPISRAMMATAGAHVYDVSQNPGTVAGSCNLHSWSQFGGGLWTGCCYTSDHAQALCMYRKPGEISSGLGFPRYPGTGYEIAYRGGGTPEQVLQVFKASAPHDAVILNAGSWAFLDPYPAMGAAMRDGWAVVWFGDTADPWR